MQVDIKGTCGRVETDIVPGSLGKPAKSGSWYVVYYAKSMQVEGSFRTKREARNFKADLFRSPLVKRAWIVSNV